MWVKTKPYCDVPAKTKFSMWPQKNGMPEVLRALVIEKDGVETSVPCNFISAPHILTFDTLEKAKRAALNMLVERIARRERELKEIVRKRRRLINRDERAKLTIGLLEEEDLRWLA